MKHKRIILTVALGALAAAVASAQFAVIDVAAIGQLSSQAAQLVREYNLLMDSYKTATNTYQQIITSAQQMAGKNSWRYAVAPLRYPSAGTAYSGYNNSTGWMATLNSGLGSANNYQMATIRAVNPNSLTAALGNGNFTSHLATVDLTDGAAQNAMSVSGAARANAQSQAGILNQLESNTYSDDPGMNTETAVLNKVNIATVMAARSSQDTNQLLAAIADQQTVAAKERRDAIVLEVNAAAAAQAAVGDNKQMLLNGNRAAHSARLP